MARQWWYEELKGGNEVIFESIASANIRRY